MASVCPPKAEAYSILCRNRRTGDFVFVDQSQTPLPGDLVAVVSARGFRVEIYDGQPFVGVIVSAEDYAHCFDLLPG